MIRYAETVVENTLGHLADHIARIEVHISDENSSKKGAQDKRCMMEARLEGHQPVAVTDDAETIGKAVSGAAGKLKSALDHTIGRLNAHKGRKHLNFNDSSVLAEKN